MITESIVPGLGLEVDADHLEPAIARHVPSGQGGRVSIKPTPMFETRYAITDHESGREGYLRIAGGIWSGDACVFEYCETVHGTAGTITCDWRSELPLIDVLEGNAGSRQTQELMGQIQHLMRPFHRGAFAGITDQELVKLYSGEYHKRMNLAVDSDFETNFKKHLLDQVLHLVEPGKVLDAGCSAGESVRQLRTRGIDAWGFDLCPDLSEVAYPEVRDVLRVGSVTKMPFDAIDGFDTLLALDLFEHIPEHRIPEMVAEIERLNVKHVVAHIALCEFQYPGHLTLRPLSWWDRQMGPSFRRITPETAGRAATAFKADPSRNLRIYERVAVPAAV
ncbi:MAG: SAM-dependent methyltransferase [Hyphomicrobiaceae bacterium]|jgi:SAM-dependent methyltransferase